MDTWPPTWGPRRRGPAHAVLPWRVASGCLRGRLSACGALDGRLARPGTATEGVVGATNPPPYDGLVAARHRDSGESRARRGRERLGGASIDFEPAGFVQRRRKCRESAHRVRKGSERRHRHGRQEECERRRLDKALRKISSRAGAGYVEAVRDHAGRVNMPCVWSNGWRQPFGAAEHHGDIAPPRYEPSRDGAWSRFATKFEPV